MKERSQKLPLWAVASLLGLVGLLLCLVSVFVRPTSPVEAQDVRSLQVWPDRSIGVASGLLEDSATHVATQVLPLGAYRSAGGDAVYGRTYLRFPLDVFPPGTEILRVTLYVYVDSGTGGREVTLGVYRALDPWRGVDADWDSDPGAWPALLTLPLAATTARFEVTPTLPVTTVTPTAVPSPLATPTLPPATLTPVATVTPTPTSTPLTSPLVTPTPSATPAPSPTLPLPVVPLSQVVGTWLTWDVTALMRAWLVGEVPNDGLVLASAPDPAAVPEAVGNLLVARWLTADDSNTQPHVIVEFEVHPVTPTPTQPPSPLATPTSVPEIILPPAGSPAGWRAVGLLFVGAALLTLGLAKWRR